MNTRGKIYKTADSCCVCCCTPCGIGEVEGCSGNCWAWSCLWFWCWPVGGCCASCCYQEPPPVQVVGNQQQMSNNVNFTVLKAEPTSQHPQPYNPSYGQPANPAPPAPYQQPPPAYTAQPPPQTPVAQDYPEYYKK